LSAFTIALAFFAALRAGTCVAKDDLLTLLETTQLRKASLSPSVFHVEAQLYADGRAHGRCGVIKRGAQVIQRLELAADTYKFARGESVVFPQDVHRDGNSDFWTLIDDARNSTWVLYRFDAPTSQFVRDSEWNNPNVDPKTRCIVEYGCFGHACGLATLAVTCREVGRWQLKFSRDQSKTVPHKQYSRDCRYDYPAPQIDYSVQPKKIQNFTLTCGGA
jgi:hypothetical protein